VQVIEQCALIIIEFHGARHAACIQMRMQRFQQGQFCFGFLVPALGQLAHTVLRLLDGIKISQRQFGVDHFDV